MQEMGILKIGASVKVLRLEPGEIKNNIYYIDFIDRGVFNGDNWSGKIIRIIGYGLGALDNIE